MKVDLNGLAGAALDGIKSPQRSPAEAAAANITESSIAEDAATLSVDSARVNSLVARAVNAPDVRQDKIEALRLAIQNGEYKVDPAQIAEAMIRESK